MTKDRKKFCIELFLVFLIFFGVRLVMLSTGVFFIWIPGVDNAGVWLLSLFTSESYQRIKLWLEFQYHSL